MDENNSIKDDVLNRIKKGEIKMKPKIYFVLRPILFLLALIVIFLVIIYFVSFIFFVFKINAGSALFGFGLRGAESLFLSLPWLIILVLLVFVLVFEALLIHYKFAYRRPVLYSLLGIIILFLLTGFVIHCTSFHANLYSINKEHGLPAIGALYNRYDKVDFKGIFCGVVSEINNDGFIVQWIDNPKIKFEVNVPPDFTKHKDLDKGDIVILFGKRTDTVINLIDLTEIKSEAFCVHRAVQE
jgi:hypothetical protein